jgi:hypothetical protein
MGMARAIKRQAALARLIRRYRATPTMRAVEQWYGTFALLLPEHQS